jgi:hypothetical protein
MELFIPKQFQDLVIPNKEQWMVFYETCKKNRDFNIACIGPYDTCKTTIIECLLYELQKEYEIEDTKKFLFQFSLYDDMCIQNKINPLSTFCQRHTPHDKFVYIENYDELKEQTQQCLKYYIDEYNLFYNYSKVHFIIESTNDSTLKDIIKSRMQCFYTTSFSSSELYSILKKMCELQWICLDENAEDFFKEKHNITITSLRLFIQKIKLLHYNRIDYTILVQYYYSIDESIFCDYFQYVTTNETKKANMILFKLYDDGYDLSDIYYYLYEYIKEKKEYVYLIGTICHFINEHYDGHYHKLYLVFLTNHIYKKYLSNNNKHT